jgi:peroxidase
MTDVRNFDDLKKEIPNKQVRDKLKKLYSDVRNIDLWVAGILEEPLEDSKLGPIFMCIIGKQMKALRDGDRFWYENENVFTPGQLRELKKTTLAGIVCENGDNIRNVQKDLFLNAKYPSGMMECNQIEKMSIEPWRNCCEKNAKGLCSEPSVLYVPVETGN